MREKWINYMKTLVGCKGIKFRRSIKPPDAIGKMWLFCFWDGANPAFGIAIYARWMTSSGEVKVTLITGKSRVAPMIGTSTQRMELEGATLVTRVALRIVHALKDSPPAKMMFLGDSNTILASRERNRGFFGEYFGNRIGETYDNIEKIQNMVDLEEPYHSGTTCPHKTTPLTEVRDY